MRLGFFGACVRGMVDPRCGEVAAFAEELGYGSMWTGEHMVLPDERPPHLREPHVWPFADPMGMLAYLAAQTSRIELCTGVAILTQRHPVHFAKEVATLDVLSGGRFVAGVGAGAFEAEMRTMGVDPDTRFERFEEHLEAVRAIWSERPVFHGGYHDFEGVTADPKPLTPGRPRFILGGVTRAGYRRAARLGDGWYGWRLDPAAAAAAVDLIREEIEGRGGDFDQFEISLTPDRRLDAAAVAEYTDAGVDQLVVVVEADDLDGVRRRLDRNAPERLGIAPFKRTGGSRLPEY